jgi:hypothetical protein
VELAAEAAGPGAGSMSKGSRFGDYKPGQLGPEPAAPTTASASPPAGTPSAPPPAPSASTDAATIAALRAVKVPFSSRITVAADQQLKAMSREGRSVTDLLAEALNLLFKKHGRDQNA